MVFTDPPYNVDYNYHVHYDTKKQNRKGVGFKLFSDKRDNAEFQSWLQKVFQNAYQYTTIDAPFYCWHANMTNLYFKQALIDSGWYISQVLIWLKEHLVFSLGQDYHRIYEPCFFGWKKDQKHYVNKKTLNNATELIMLDKNTFEEQLDIIYEHRDAMQDYVHPTQKPVRLAERALKRHSEKGFIVLDCFGGSGSTLMACEQLNRICYMIELDPYYCQQIINRYEQYSGKKAVKVN